MLEKRDLVGRVSLFLPPLGLTWLGLQVYPIPKKPTHEDTRRWNVKPLLILGMMLCLLVISPQGAFADATIYSDQGGVSEAGVTFKGYAEDFETPDQSANQDGSSIPNGSNTTVVSNVEGANKRSLPHTGDTHSQLVFGAGIGLLGLGIYRWKKTTKKNEGTKNER